MAPSSGVKSHGNDQWIATNLNAGNEVLQVNMTFILPVNTQLAYKKKKKNRQEY